MTTTPGSLNNIGGDVHRAIQVSIAPLPTARLGIRLRELRESSGLDLREVALLPELRSELEGIEAGALRPDAALVQVLLDCYGASLEELLPPRGTLVVTEGSDREVLARYVAEVRGWRGSANHPRLRQADVEVLAGILGTDVKGIQERLRRHAIEERIAPLSTTRLGFLVNKLRESTRSTPDKATRLPEMLQSQLEAVGAGRLRPDAALLEGLLSYYGADLDELVPPRETLVVIGGTDKEVLTRYLTAVRRWRGNVKRPQLRAGDLAVLAGILGTDPRDIERRLRKLTGCSRRRARRLTVMILAGMAVAPAGAALLHSSGGPTTSNAQTNLRSNQIQLVDAIRDAVGDHAALTHRSHTKAPVAAAAAVAVAVAPVTTAPVAAAPAAAAAAVAVAPVTTAPVAVAPVTTAPVAAAPVAVAPVAAAPVTTAPVHSVAADCATALAYLAAHAKPGFAHYCRPGGLTVGIAHAVAYTCVPGPSFSCPDGNAEIIIADPGCAATYENEASNSYWDFSSGGVIQPGATQDGRTWDPYGSCP